MNATQAENLRILIRHMETNVKGSLYMGTITHACGTPACAMGHARTISAFSFNDNIGEDARDVFGLDGELFANGPNRWSRLFGGVLYINGVTTVQPTPQEWAAEARKVLAENGYDDKPAEFIAALEKLAREPNTLKDPAPNWDHA